MAKDKKRKEHEISIRSEEKVNQILEEIKTAQSRNIAPESVLEKISPYLEQEPFLTVHLIEALARIPDPDTAQLLIEMMEKMKEKSIIKSIKKTLYKLKQKGVRWQEKPQKYDPVLKPLKPAEPEGYLGAIDSTGSRVIAITRSLPLRGFMAVISITNDLAGIQEFNLGEFTKKSFNEFLKGSLSSAEFPIVAAPGAYCVRLLKENASLSKKLLKPLPQGYHDFENEFGDVQWNAPGPIIYQHIKEDELKDNWRLLKDSGTLHQINPFSTWFLNAQDVRKYVSSIKESQESRIVLLPDQKEARLNNIYRRALEELFPEEIRLLWKTRLEEMAYILLETGKEKEAKTAVRAAIDLKNPFSAIDPNPFIWNLLLKSIYVWMEIMKKQKKKKSHLSLLLLEPFTKPDDSCFATLKKRTGFLQEQKKIHSL